MDKETLIDIINTNFQEGIHIVDDKGKTLLYNNTMADFEEMEIEAVLNKQLLDVLPSLQGKSTLMQVLETGQPITMNYQTYFNKNGKQISTLNSTWPIIKNNAIIGAVEIAKDISNLEKGVHSFLYFNESTKQGKKNKNTTAKFTLDDILGNSPEISNAKQIARMASKTDSSVLIIGQSGTGKELFAQSIHNASKRKYQPFVAENCAALPETLLEGLLFGTARGGFTGAIDRAGLLEQANGGTLLLDEINSMPLGLQAKLLRVLQESKFRPIGSTREIEVNVRIIAITNEDPFKLIEDGTLREDLFYRLSVVNLHIPPLHSRVGDIEVLEKHFIKLLEKKLHKTVAGVSPEVSEFFHNYQWPGNVRELQHVLEGALNIIEDHGTITLEHLPYYMKRHFYNQPKAEKSSIPSPITLHTIEGKAFNLNEYMDRVEEQFISEALRVNGLNITKAAEALGITRQGLQYKLKKKVMQDLIE
ncbi:sigma-54 interaction domain-containing protein [Alkaliphilus oremlandii]|uniref:PAS modulated sigma54 specific transcriptional regulator, Fis family n=1 Tax=Alkaliphilus oremlandii (strain OhILAs) TaxID=350688 RepID=A8MJP6_ALKOO|nr:sigma 54-interacting transcriptional regulator [Alkaliphilus oremlandii]ABW20028.1 PAS modulated sigma54 specific transcriptional regulator, Fis family [Alkaliphilus oremlandii OhILAs]